LNEADGSPIELAAAPAEAPAEDPATEEAEAPAEAETESAAAEPAAEAAPEAEATETETATETAETETETAAAEATEAEAPAETETAAAEGTEAPVEATEEATEDASTEAAAAEEEATEEVAAAPAAEAEPAAEPAAAAANPIFATVTVGDGEKLFRKCRSCHVLDDGKNRVGPHLYGIVGRPVAAVDGFKYSDAMANYGGEWTPDRLMEYLGDPRGVVPGTKMVFAGFKKPEDRAAIVKYLNENSASPLALE
ncbi:MAG: cytochrome c family protein, partial [Pseudomonadota bacterium]